MASVEFTTQELATEEWRPVVGWEGLYSIGKILACPVGRWGYRNVTLPAKPQKQAKVHQLVAAAFIGPRPKGMDVNHIDGVKTNNRAVNLEYISEGDNSRHAARLGLAPAGVRHGNAIFTETDIRAIRASRLGGEACSAIAKRYATSRQQIHRICTGKAWMSVT